MSMGLFRGKMEFSGSMESLDHWVFGHYWSYKKRHYIMPIGSMKNVRVNPKSVGQYSTIDDVDSEKIFAGDIVEITFEGARQRALVWFSDGAFLCEIQGSHSFHINDMEDMIKIGNKFDNPKLLSEEL